MIGMQTWQQQAKKQINTYQIDNIQRKQLKRKSDLTILKLF